MSPEKQRIAIAEVCGWKHDRYWIRPDGKQFAMGLDSLPDYLSDLNAMHEAEKVHWDDFKFVENFGQWLIRITLQQPSTTCVPATQPGVAIVAHATAAQRAEAFLRIFNLWQDE